MKKKSTCLKNLVLKTLLWEFHLSRESHGERDSLCLDGQVHPAHHCQSKSWPFNSRCLPSLYWQILLSFSNPQDAGFQLCPMSHLTVPELLWMATISYSSFLFRVASALPKTCLLLPKKDPGVLLVPSKFQPHSHASSPKVGTAGRSG